MQTVASIDKAGEWHMLIGLYTMHVCLFCVILVLDFAKPLQGVYIVGISYTPLDTLCCTVVYTLNFKTSNSTSYLVVVEHVFRHVLQ